VYRVTPSGSVTTVTILPNPGVRPFLQASDSNLYGVACCGGANGNGYVFKVTLAGQYTLLYTFGKGPANVNNR